MGLPGIRTAELIDSASGSESAVGSCSDGSRPQFGYGPKLFHSILRFQRLLSLSRLTGMVGTHRKGYAPRSRARSATSGNPAPGYYSEMCPKSQAHTPKLRVA